MLQELAACTHGQVVQELHAWDNLGEDALPLGKTESNQFALHHLNGGVEVFLCCWLIMQAKLVKDAVEDVLMKVKQSRHLIMLSPFEQRMSCLSHIARCGFSQYGDLMSQTPV